MSRLGYKRRLNVFFVLLLGQSAVLVCAYYKILALFFFGAIYGHCAHFIYYLQDNLHETPPSLNSTFLSNLYLQLSWIIFLKLPEWSACTSAIIAIVNFPGQSTAPGCGLTSRSPWQTETRSTSSPGQVRTNSCP